LLNISEIKIRINMLHPKRYAFPIVPLNGSQFPKVDLLIKGPTESVTIFPTLKIQKDKK
jgi:hypothetical protein